MGRIFQAAKQNGFEVFISPTISPPQTMDGNSPDLDAEELETKMFAKTTNWGTESFRASRIGLSPPEDFRVAFSINHNSTKIKIKENS